MMEFAALNFDKNQEIVVTTAKGKYHGKFNKLSFDGSRLDVSDVFNGEGKSCGAFKYFFKKDVINVSAVGEESSGSELSSGSSEPPETSLLTPPQLQNITQSIKNVSYIHQLDAKYFEALQNISKQFVIGISSDCCRGRIYNISLLTISTADKIFIFDLPALNRSQFIKELKQILSSDSHLKIVHDSRMIIDNFKIKFNIELQPVFDVMLSAAQFHPKENVLKLENCVKSMLGIDVDIKSNEVFTHRPLTPQDLTAIANKSAFLIAIYQKLASKSFSMIFQKNVPKAEKDFERFFDGLCLTDIEKLENQSLTLQLQKEVDFSIYEERD